jgi:hypothetical protein
MRIKKVHSVRVAPSVVVCVFVLMVGVTLRVEATPQAARTFQVGAVTMQITAVTIDSEGQPFLRPPRGRDFLIIDVIAENTGETDVAVSSFLSFKLYSAAGQEYELATMYRTNGTMDATLRPGGRVIGQLAYIVPTTERVFRLETRIGSVFNPDVVIIPLSADQN